MKDPARGHEAGPRCDATPDIKPCPMLPRHLRAAALRGDEIFVDFPGSQNPHAVPRRQAAQNVAVPASNRRHTDAVFSKPPYVSHAPPPSSSVPILNSGTRP